MIQQANRKMRGLFLMLLLFSSITLLFGQTPDSSLTNLHAKNNGIVYQWDYDSVCSHTTYVEGKREGPYSKWKGKLMFLQGQYVNDRREGLFIEWNYYGQKISETHYKHGKVNGLITSWHSGSSKQDYYKQSESQYVDDQLDGRSIYWFPNGQIQLIEEYKAGEKIGVVDEWLENGKRLKMDCDTILYNDNQAIKSIVHYSNKVKNGTCTLFDEHGKRKAAVNYVQGRKEGKQQSWYPNGVLSCEGNYTDGKRNGLFKTWDCKGKLAFEVQFNNDKLDKVTYYNTSKGLKRLQYPTPPLTEFEDDDYSQIYKTSGCPLYTLYSCILNPNYAIIVIDKPYANSPGYNFPCESGSVGGYKQVFVKTDTLVLIHSLNQLKKIFTPIESESEAIYYSNLLTGKNVLDSIVLPKDATVYQKNVPPTYAKKESEGYRVLLFDYNIFGSLPHMYSTCEYLVTFSGDVTLISKKNFYTDPGNNWCVDTK